MQPFRVVLLAASLTAAAVPSTAQAGVIDTAKARGDFAMAIASGTVENPGTIRVRITPSPRQKWDGNWNMVCSKGTGAGGKDGKFKGSRTRTIRLRMPMSNPDSCTVSAGASLSRGGRITVQILG